MGKLALGCGAAVLVALVVIGGLAASRYNALVTADEAVASQWAQVENTYQRRADLVPNLVATVKGASEFEQETLNQVVEARSRVGQVTAQMSPEGFADAEQLARFEAAQNQLSSALSRLLVVVERYPELRSVAAFQDLMVQLEGTENRIAVERKRFNDVARTYNTRIKRFPDNVLIALLGWSFEARPYFAAQPGSEEAPRVEF